MGDIFDEVAEEYKKQYKGDIFDEVAKQYTLKKPPFEARHPNLYALGKTAIEVPKLIGKRLGAGALEGLAEINKILPYLPPFWPLLMPETHKKYKEYTVTPALRWAEKLRKSARGEGKLDEGLLSFIEGMGTMIPTLPADIMTGGATKAALVPRITEKAAKILAKIPDFAIGMGIRGFAGGIEEGKPLKAIQQAIENTGFGLIYSKLQAGRLKDLPKWLAIGIAEPTYQATKQGRLPTPEELISGLGTNTGYFLLFSTLPILKQNIKDAAERKAIEKYEEKLQKTEDPEKEIEELFKDPAISEQTKKSLEQLVDESNKVLASTPAQTQLPLKPSAPAPESSVELLRQLYEEAGLLRQGKKLFPEMQKPEEKSEVKPEPITPKTPEKPATQDIFDEIEKEIEIGQKLEVEKAKKEAKPELETLTEEEKQILRDRGFTESQIDRLLPEEGRKLIDEGLSPEEVSVLRDGKVKVIKTQPENKKEPFAIKGNTTSAYLPDGKKIDFAYKVVDADDLISSHQYDGIPNPEYPKELQPRMRERKASIEQIVTIANNLIPEKLGENPNVSDGAPIVGKDLVVESGNGRIAAIRLAYDRGKANHYKQWLIENAKRFGLDPKEIAKIEKPVLVRERITDVNRKEFVKKANEATTARMSPLEQAKADADRLTDADIDLLDIPEDGNIFAKQNRDFVKTFLAKLPKEESSQYYTNKGDYTKQLADRITSALFYKAYGDDYLASLQAEEANPEIKNILNALIANSKNFIKAKTIDTTGQTGKVVKAIVDAVREYKKTKDLGITVEHHLAQQQLFTELPEHVGELMKAIDRNKRSSKKLANMLKYIAEATKQQAERFTNQQLFGDKPLPSEELVYEGLKRYEKLGAGGEHGQPRLLEGTTEESGKIRRGKGEGVEEGEIEHEAVTKPEEVRESLKFKPAQLTLQFTEPAKKAQISTKQRVVLRTTGYIKAQGYVVRNADDTASLLSPLRKKAQEEVYFVITDKDGRVLEILRYSKGTKKSSEIEPSEIAGRIFSIPNAKKVYFIHNHPAVSHQPSASDVRVYARLKDIFALGGIDTEGLVISGKHYTTFNEAKFSELQEIKPAIRKIKIPVKERFIVRESSFWKATSIQTPEKAIEAIKEYQNKDGFLILNTKNRDIGFYVYDPNKSAQENFVNLAKLIEATNANAVIFNTKKLTPEQASLYELITSRGFIPVYDVIENGESLQAKGELDTKITQARLANPVEESIIHYTAGSVANTAKEILKFAKDSKIDIDPEDLSLLRLYSDIPSWLRNESPEFKKVFDVVDERWRNFNTIRNIYLKELFDAWKSLSKKEKERVGKILYKGDELRKELSDEALVKLTPNERRAYKVTREVLNFIWNEELPMLMEELGVPKTEIEQYRREVGNVTGYMPHPRKGAYYIFVKDPKTKEILYHTMFDDLIATLTGGKYSPKGAKLKKILREQFGADKIIKVGKHTERFPEEAYFEVSPLVTQELINVAMEKVEGSEKLKQTFKQAIEQAIADVFKVRGFMKHGIKRKGVPGYEVENWQDAVIEYINGWAGYKSKLLAAKKLNETWGKIDWGQKHNLRAYAEKYVKDTFANQTQFDRAVDKFRAFLFYKYLGGVLKSAALQLTQNFVTAIPRLTVETNWAGSKLTAEMMRSGMDLIKALYTKPAEGMSRRETAMAKRLTEEELRALARAKLDGTISDQLTEEVMGMMPGKYGSLPREFAKALRWMFGVAEIFNRETTFLTAFRIAREEKGMNFEDAYKFASKIIDETHFRYGKFNLPPFARGRKLAKVARSAYTFRSFTHNILHLYKNLASDYGWRGKWGLAKSFMAILALGGIKGLPFASTINWVYRKVTGSDLFQGIAEIAGDWYKAVLYGAPSFLGIDLTGSISIEMPRTLKELVGVPYDIGSGLAKTYQDIQTRDFWRAVEDFPLFLNVMRYPLQAYRLTTRGIETRHGKRVVDSDFKPLKLTTGEGLLKAVGFQPITLSEAYRKAETSRAIRGVWKEKKDTLVSAWAKAINRGDEKTAKGLLEQMMEYNKKVVEKVSPDVAKGLFITNETLWRRMQPERLRALEKRE